MGCELTKFIAAQSCDELKAVAGNTVKAYIGVLGSGGLTAFTAAAGVLTALTFESGTGLIEVVARKEGITDNSATAGGEAGAGKVQTQNVLISLKKLGKEYREAVNDILNTEKAFVIVRSNAAEFKVFGIFDLLDTSLVVSKGMMATYETDSGILFTDVMNQTITLTGESKYFAGMLLDAGSVSATQALIDAALYSESSSSSGV